MPYANLIPGSLYKVSWKPGIILYNFEKNSSHYASHMVIKDKEIIFHLGQNNIEYYFEVLYGNRIFYVHKNDHVKFDQVKEK